jgi:uridylate kinase
MGYPIYKRIVLKLSGELMAGELGCGIDGSALHRLSSQVCAVRELGVEVAVVVGGGNFVRGASGRIPGIDRIQADSMGMLATMINALALKSSLEARGILCSIQSAIPIEGIALPFHHGEALSHLKQGNPIIFAGGTGHPYFTTDTTAVLRAVEIEADAVLKGTKVDGIYSSDPTIDPHATKYDQISFFEVLRKGLKVVDATAAALCMDHNVPLIVFNVQQQDVLRRIMLGEPLGTVVKGADDDKREL